MQQVVHLFQEREHLILAIAPEGTRKYVAKWHSGFYYMALGAKVPIVLCYLDYARKVVGIGPIFYPTGDYETDIEKIKDFYRPIRGKYPDQGVR